MIAVPEVVTWKPSEKWRIIKNVVIISSAFMVHFTAYQGAANLQSSINSEAGLGTASLASVYASLIISNLFLSVVVVKWLGCKWAVAVSFVAYMPFMAAQFYPRFYTLIPAGLMVGLGGGPLWCAKCTYLTVIGEAYSKISGIPAEVLIVRFFGVFFMVFQFSQVWGNLISSLVLSSGNTSLISSINASLVPELCGASFLASSDAGEALESQPPEKIRTIAGIYLACMVAASLIVTFGVDSLKRYDKGRAQHSAGALSARSLLVTTLQLLREPNQLLIILITTWLGLGQAFMGADFTSAYVSCALGTSYVGYVMIAYGLANSVSAISTGYIVKLTGRPPVVVCAAVLQTSLLVTLLLWQPQASRPLVFYAIAALWGVCDGIWLVQINAFNGILFPGREEAAYSNFRLWESLGFILAYLYSPYLRTSSKIHLMIVALLLGVGLYLVAEFRIRVSSKTEDKKVDPDSEPPPGCDNGSFSKTD